MNLDGCELIPSVIVDTKDEMKLGRIKCVIPGYVDPSFSKENMPWVRPLCMTRHQSFSKMMPGYKVWVLANKNNYNEFWYLPFFELNDISKNFLESTYDADQPEIIVSHNTGGNHAMMTYDETSGFNTKIGENHMQLKPDGHVSIVGGTGQVDINGSNIKVGSVGGDYEPAILGNKLLEILIQLKNAFVSLKESASSSSQTVTLVPGFTEAENALSEAEKILCTTTQVN